MKKNTRAQKAQETLEIIEQGYYEVNDQKIEIRNEVSNSRENSVLYRPDGFGDVMAEAGKRTAERKFDTIITVLNTTVLKAARGMTLGGETVGCLNFASAKNPGGGFLGGAQAQEESLAVSSTLYPTLMKHFEMYEYNRGQKTYLYSDYMVYSPGVVMFRDDDGDVLEKPYKLSIVTSPATNIGAIKVNKPEEMEFVKETMLRRTDKMLSVFAANDIEHLLLGAWGCGVFQNDADEIAEHFAHYLTGNGKYASCFKSVVFAVYDRSPAQKNITAFNKWLKPETIDL